MGAFSNGRPASAGGTGQAPSWHSAGTQSALARAGGSNPLLANPSFAPNVGGGGGSGGRYASFGQQGGGSAPTTGYGALARGDAHLYLRFPPKEYREKVWDHAAGVAVVSAAGGVITDGEGNVLDFTKGRFLDQKGGIVASANPSLHAARLEALAKIDE